MPVLSHSKSKIELVAFHAAPCMTCYPLHMSDDQYLQMIESHAELLICITAATAVYQTVQGLAQVCL